MTCHPEAYPDFLLRRANEIHVCGFLQRKPQELRQRHQPQQEIRGSEVEGSAVVSPPLRDLAR